MAAMRNAAPTVAAMIRCSFFRVIGNQQPSAGSSSSKKSAILTDCNSLSYCTKICFKCSGFPRNWVRVILIKVDTFRVGIYG